MVNALFTLVVVLAAFLLTCHACLDEEVRSLLLFKKRMLDFNTSDYFHLSTWKEGSDCCNSWKGVVCNPLTHHVQSLDFSNDVVAIEDCETLLPLSNLQGLTSLDMDVNSFNVSLVLRCLGRFPSLREITLGYSRQEQGSSISSAFQEWPSEALQRLTRLDLWGKGLSGSLPPQLRNMTSLAYLDLSDNKFTSDFHELHSLSNLRHLLLDELINPDKVTWSAWNFSRLVKLSLKNCPIKQQHIEKMKWLKLNKGMEYLALDDNMLTNISFIGHFPHLRELTASRNSIEGTIPYSIGNLTSLHTLDLSSNQLDGRIPMSIGNLSSLEMLDLSYNILSGSIPMSIRNLSSLEKLDLSHNSLSGSIPMSIRNLSSIKQLYLSNNNLSGSIPMSIGNLSSLEMLDLSTNSLSGSIPCSLSNLSRLAYLDISGNQLNGSISCLALSSSLTYVDFGENQMEGAISEAFLSNLVKLYHLGMTRSGLSMNVSNTWIPGFSCEEILLGSCKINSSFPQWISTQPDLGYLDLSDNRLYGEIPSWLWEFPPRDVLAGLNLSHNELEGHVNDLGHFGTVDLSFNKLKGSMPALFTLSNRLSYFFGSQLYLNFRNNSFEGPLTSDLAVTALQFLDVSDNKLTGPIPSVYNKCSKIQFLNLANNNLSGSLPIGFGGNFQRLQFLSLFNNKLEGTLPESLSASNRLQVLNVGNNVFGGQFPKWITQLKELRILEMKSNRLEGNIPEELGTMQYLQFIDISSNCISGQIPKNISALPRLSREVQDFSTENISADVSMYSHRSPSVTASTMSTLVTYVEIEFYAKGLLSQYHHIPSQLACLDLSNNLLTGEIPTDLGNLKGLMLLNLSRNNLTGPIPASIGDMSALEELDLSDNKLSGRIPNGFARLDSVGFLNLSHNNLSGKIPREGHMLTFEHQYFEGNPNLNDSLPQRKRPKQTQTEATSEEESGGHDQEFWWAISVGVSFGVGFAAFVSAWVLESRFRKYVNSSMDPIILWLFRDRY